MTEAKHIYDDAGRLIGLEGEVDLIAAWKLTLARKPKTPADDLLVPAPFSLSCFGCDAGDEIQSKAEATAKGWTKIEFSPADATCNYMGLCPECKWDGWPDMAEVAK